MTVVVAAILVTVTTLVLGVLGAADSITRRNAERTRLRRVTAAQADELAAALALPVWNIDSALIDKILDSQTGAMPVEAIMVTAAGHIHARARDANRKLVASNGIFSTEGLLVEERAIVFSGEKIGTVRLYTTPRFFQADLRRAMTASVAAILAVDALLVLSIYWVLWRTVLGPLVSIEKFAGAVSAGVEEEAPAVEPARTAELERLRLSIESMVRAIKSEKEFTETALDVMNEVFFVQDRHGRFVRWNKAMVDIFGLFAIKQEGRYILNQLAHPDDRAVVMGKIDEIFEGSGSAGAEVRYLLPDGTRYIQLSGRRMEIDGEPYIVGTGVDVTERRIADAERLKLREAIQQSAVEWRQTFDSVSTPIVITDAEGVIRRVNHSATLLAAQAEWDMVGKPIRGMVASPWSAAAELRGGITNDEQGRTWEISVSELFLDSEAWRVLVFMDVTRIVALQESLRRSETMTAMGKLVGGVAHEVRNPLFGISATLDAYGEEMNTPDLKEMAATLRDQVGRLSRLMQELLEFGKPVAVTRRPGALDALVEEVIASRHTSANEANVVVRSQLSESVPRIPMDRDRLRQVFENLVDNALQHSPRGTVVTISGDLMLHAGRKWVEMRVEDQGKGFVAGETAHVFEPFFTRREHGTGLGLSIVQKIVEEHEGSVTAGNREEGGARITIRLPA